MSEQTAQPNSTAKNAIARIYKGNRVIGAGFLVEGGYVLTCAHVIRDALGLKEENAYVGETVKIDFPYVWLKQKLKQKLTAQVLLYRYAKTEEAPDEDIAGLRILDPLPTGVPTVKLLVGYQLDTPYKTLGFPKGHPKGLPSQGKFSMDLPNGVVVLQGDESGSPILPGFSGSPVWDATISTVFGMVMAREGSQLEAKIGFMVPARALLAVQRELGIQDLLSILQCASETLTKAIKTSFRLCCPAGWEIPTELPELLLKLQDAKRGARRFAPIDCFVALLTLPELNPDPSLQQRLKAWVEPRVEQFQLLLEEVKPLLTQHLASQSADTVSHLLIYVQDESEESRSVSALFVRDASDYNVQFGMGSERVHAPGNEPFQEKVTLETLPSLVRACLSEVMDKSPTNLTLHLILPLAWLNKDCDRWSTFEDSKYASFMPEVRLGSRFCCVVRITERLNPEILKLFKEPWQNKWTNLLSLASKDIVTAFVLGDGLLLETELFARLNSSTSVGLKLSTVYEEDQYPKLFGVLIATGTPAAIWLRHNQFSDEVCASTDLDRLLDCKIAKLPETVKQFRSDALAAAENAHIGHHLSLLWEDPRLIPPSTQMSLGMPQS